MKNHKDHLVRRCPRLGGPVSFRYCRIDCEENRPCYKILDCWWETFDVATHLKAALPEDRFNTLMDSRPVPKVMSLVELIQQARERQEKNKME